MVNKKKFKTLYIAKPRDLNSINNTELNLAFTLHSRGHEVHVCYPHNFYVKEGGLYAITRKPNAEVIMGLESYLEYISNDRLIIEQRVPVTDLNIIFARSVSKDLEDMIYDNFLLTYLQCVKYLCPSSVFVNDPDSISKAGSKIYDSLLLKNVSPETHITKDEHRIKELISRGGEWIAKPVDALGGAHVIGINKDLKRNLGPLIQLMLNDFYSPSNKPRPFILQKVVEGLERRLVLLNGSEIVFSFAKIPSGDDLRGNASAGAQFKDYTPSDVDRELVAKIAPVLQKDGLYLSAADVIGPTENASLDNTKLLELNVRCPQWPQWITSSEGWRAKIENAHCKIVEFVESLYEEKNKKKS